MNKVIIERVQEAFFKRLDEKTNWGRNQLKRVYREAINEVLLEMIDEESPEKNIRG